MKILVVEDDSFFAQRLTEFLSDNGLHSTTIRTVQDALNEKLDDYCAAIIDVMLPNDPTVSGISVEETRGGYLSGIALTRRLKQVRPNFPFIMLSSDLIGGEAKDWAKKNNVPFIFKHEDRRILLSSLANFGIIKDVPRPRSFIVHGHDKTSLLELKDYLQNTLKWPEPVIIREQPNCGKTIIEKFEEHAGLIDWIFILVTPDDKAFDPKTNEEKRRARQNVIFELGFFYGLIGRLEGRVVVLRKGDVELPSDIHGIAWINIDNGIHASGEEIRKEVGC